MIGNIGSIPPPLAYARQTLQSAFSTYTNSTTIDFSTFGSKRLVLMIFISAASGTGINLEPVLYIKDSVHNVFMPAANGPNFTASGQVYSMHVGPDIPIIPGQAVPPNQPSLGASTATYTSMLTDNMRLQFLVSGTTPSFTVQWVIYGDNL